MDRTHHLAGVMVHFMVSWLQFQTENTNYMHGGGEQGFVPNVYIQFKSHRKTGHYQSGMNLKYYEK
jgi:hypothetical protein